MATAAAELFVRVSADTKGLTTGFEGATKAAKDMGGKVASATESIGTNLDNAGKKAGIFGDVFKGAFVGNLAADAAAKVIGFFTNQLTSAVSSLMEVEKANAQTVSVIKSTGGAAGVTAQHVMDYANSLERTTGVAAENIQRGQNLLLTFTNIRNGVGATNQIFDQATDIMVDLSAAMGGDAKGAAIQLGKALNDPTQGITALTRVGVSFTDGQKAQIKALQESGDIMGAQKIILAELRKEFGGSAEALGKTLPGAINRLDNGIQAMMKNFMSPATGILTNGIIMAADASFKLADIIEGKGGIGDSFRKAFGPTTQALIVGIGTTVTLAALPAITAMLPALAAVAVAFIPVAIAAAKFIAIAGVIAAAAYPIAKNWDTIREVMGRIVDRIIYYWDEFRNKVASVAAEGYQMLTTAFTKASAVIRSIIGDKLADGISKTFGTMQVGAISFGRIVSKSVSDASGFAKKHWGGAADDLKSIWSRLTTVTKADLSKLGKTVKDTGTEMAKTGEAGKKASEKAAKAAKDAQAAHEALAKATQKGYEKFELMARALTTLSARLRAVDSEAAAQGRSFDIAGAKANAYKEGLSAIESAFGKMSIQAENARAEMERFAQASANGGAATAQAYGVIDQATKALDNQAFAAQALGKEWDATAEGIKSAEGVLTDLIDKGLRPGNKAYDEAAEELAKLKKSMTDTTLSFEKSVSAANDVASSFNSVLDSVNKLALMVGLQIPNGMNNFAKSMGDGVIAVMTLVKAYEALKYALAAYKAVEDTTVVLFAIGLVIGAISFLNKLYEESRAAAIAAQEEARKEALANEEIMRRNIENLQSSNLEYRLQREQLEANAEAAKKFGDSLSTSVKSAIKSATVAFIAGADDWRDKLRNNMKQAIFDGLMDAIIAKTIVRQFDEIIDQIVDAFDKGNQAGASNLIDQMVAKAADSVEKIGGISIKFLESIGVGGGEAMQLARQAMGAATAAKGNASNLATLRASQQHHTAILTRLSNVAGGRETEEYQRSLRAANELSEWIRMEQAGMALPATSRYLATGGMVTGPTMARLGEGGRPEAVLPLNENVYRQIGQGIAAARGGGGGAQVVVQYYGNGKWTREDAQGLGRLLVSELRTMGVKA